jgi:hypothetical protein
MLRGLEFYTLLWHDTSCCLEPREIKVLRSSNLASILIPVPAFITHDGSAKGSGLRFCWLSDFVVGLKYDWLQADDRLLPVRYWYFTSK